MLTHLKRLRSWSIAARRSSRVTQDFEDLGRRPDHGHDQSGRPQQSTRWSTATRRAHRWRRTRWWTTGIVVTVIATTGCGGDDAADPVQSASSNASTVSDVQPGTSVEPAPSSVGGDDQDLCIEDSLETAFDDAGIDLPDPDDAPMTGGIAALLPEEDPAVLIALVEGAVLDCVEVAELQTQLREMFRTEGAIDLLADCAAEQLTGTAVATRVAIGAVHGTDSVAAAEQAGREHAALLRCGIDDLEASIRSSDLPPVSSTARSRDNGICSQDSRNVRPIGRTYWAKRRTLRMARGVEAPSHRSASSAHELWRTACLPTRKR